MSSFFDTVLPLSLLIGVLARLGALVGALWATQLFVVFAYASGPGPWFFGMLILLNAVLVRYPLAKARGLCRLCLAAAATRHPEAVLWLHRPTRLGTQRGQRASRHLARPAPPRQTSRLRAGCGPGASCDRARLPRWRLLPPNAAHGQCGRCQVGARSLSRQPERLSPPAASPTGRRAALPPALQGWGKRRNEVMVPSGRSLGVDRWLRPRLLQRANAGARWAVCLSGTT
jgi:hypothetical protein